MLEEAGFKVVTLEKTVQRWLENIESPSYVNPRPEVKEVETPPQMRGRLSQRPLRAGSSLLRP